MSVSALQIHIFYGFVCMYEDLFNSEVQPHRLYDWIGLLYFTNSKYRTYVRYIVLFMELKYCLYAFLAYWQLGFTWNILLYGILLAIKQMYYDICILVSRKCIL